MAEPNAETNAGNSSRTWERNSTRQAILDAARRLAAREGAEAITLSRVAAEAGFAPPAVYAYFVSKDDLHLAVVADDLEKLARVMRGEDADSDAVASAPVAEEEAGEAEAMPAADVIAFAPPPTREAELPFDGMMQGSFEDVAEEIPQDEPPPGDEMECAGEDAAFAEHDVAADVPVAEPAEPVAEEPAGDVSLAEIEQALGVVLAENDFADEAVEEEVPNAFPEETDTELSAEAEVDDHVSTAAAVEGEPKSFGTRFWRNRRAEGEAQIAMPLDAEPAQHPVEALTDIAQMAATIAQLQETVARLEARPVDSWLERRLRVFERTLADIEARMEKTERDSMTALSTVSEGFKALDGRLSGTLEDGERRATESEQRYRAAAADLRQYVKDLSGRLSAVETGLSRALGDPADHFGHRARLPEVMPETEPAAEAEVEAEPHTESRAGGPGYLSAARSAAKAAAAKAEVQQSRSPLSYLSIEPADARRILRSRRTLQLVAGVLTLIVALIAASMVLRGRATPTPAAVPQAAQKVTMSPDARVAALAKAGDARAQLVAALKLLNGDGVATDVPSAAHWLRKAADQHQPLAEYWLGTLYERGRGVALDRAKAMGWYEPAAAAGNAKAMYRLGVGAAEGWNGEPNYTEAAKWFSKAAELGIIDAQYNLAVLYERGDGVPQNMAEAFKWYAIAASQGDAQSKARIDALASEMQTEAVATAQAEAAAFTPKPLDPAANVEPTVNQVASGR